MLRFVGPFDTVIWRLGCFWARMWTGTDLDRHRPIDAVSQMAPDRLLILHGTSDGLISIEEGRALHEAIGRQARFIAVKGYRHAETLHHPDYARWLDEFFGP